MSQEINSCAWQGSAFELSASEGESDDICLPPYKPLIDHTRESDRPVTRPRPKRELKYMDEKDTEKALPTRTPTSIPAKNQESSGCSLQDVTKILLTPVAKIKELLCFRKGMKTAQPYLCLSTGVPPS
ncbi:Shugoshin 1 [Lemmus lemmus]